MIKSAADISSLCSMGSWQRPTDLNCLSSTRSSKAQVTVRLDDCWPSSQDPLSKIFLSAIRTTGRRSRHSPGQTCLQLTTLHFLLCLIAAKNSLWHQRLLARAQIQGPSNFEGKRFDLTPKKGKGRLLWPTLIYDSARGQARKECLLWSLFGREKEVRLIPIEMTLRRKMKGALVWAMFTRKAE